MYEINYAGLVVMSKAMHVNCILYARQILYYWKSLPMALLSFISTYTLFVYKYKYRVDLGIGYGHMDSNG